MVRSFAVFGMVFAGVALLAGLGWALLAGAVLMCVLWRREPEWRRLADRLTVALSRARGRVAAAPRRAVAMTGMGGGLALLPVGLALSAGAGVAVAVGGGLLIGYGLLTGWGA